MPILIAMFFGIVFLGQSAFKAYLKTRGAREVYMGVTRELQELAVKKSDLEKRLAYLSTSYGLERELRRQFGLVKDGEGLIVIIDRQTPAALDENGGMLESFFAKMEDFLKKFFNTGQ